MAVTRPLLCALLTTAGESAAQSPAKPAQIPEFRVGSERVMLTATAVDRRGRVVRDLRQDELVVLEDGHPQRLVYFDTARQQSARILLLVDTSGSMAGNAK